MAELPTGTVTFLFTDIEGSTRLWIQQPEVMRQILPHHNAVLYTAIEGRGGYVFKTMGDGFCAAFAHARDAAQAAVDAQSALYREVPQLRVRMALHTGAAEMRDGDYFGPALSHVARLLYAGHGGQVLVSRATAELLQPSVPPDTRLRFLGTHRLRDIAAMETIFNLLIRGLPSEFPPLNTLDVAFRRGLLRAAAVSLVVIAVMAGLLATAVTMAHRWRVASEGERQARLGTVRLLALDQTERGVKQLEDGNGLGLLDLIEARRTAEPLPDLKEAIATVWAGWHQAYAGRLISAVGHDRAVLDVKFSPDGTRLATASEDNTVQLWDTRTWEAVGRPLRHIGAVFHVAFSPDGKLLASGSFDRTVRLWDAATGEPRGRPMQHEDAINSIAFSPAGKLLASGCNDGTVRLWDTETGQRRGRPLRPDGNSVQSGRRDVLVGFAPPPENLLVTVTWRGVSLWNPATGESLGRLLRRERPSSIAPVLAFGRDGAVRAIASEQTVWLWDPAGRRYRGDLIHDPGVVGDLALSSDGSLLATVGPNDPIVQLWETSTGKRAGPALFHPARVDAIAFGPRGGRLLVTLCKGLVRFWDTSTGQLYPDHPPTPGGVWALALSPDGRALATAAANGTVHLWAVDAQPPWRKLPLPSGAGAIASVEDGDRLATYSRDGVRLWSAETGQLLSRPAGVPGQGPGAFSQDGQFLVQWGGQSVTVRETRTGRTLGPPLRLPQTVRRATLSSHGAVLATLSSPDTVELWDTASKRPRREPWRHPTPGGIVEYSPDERLLATAAGGNVYLWETATGRLHLSIHVAGEPEWVAFSPDSRLLAVALQDQGAVRLWSTASGRPYLRPLEHPAPVHSVSVFSPDGKRLATVTRENTVRLWDLASGQPAGPPMPHPDLVLAVRFSPDGKRLATASQSGAWLWDVATCQLVSRPLLPRESVTQAVFARKGSVLALVTDIPKQDVYLWRLPAAPAGLAEMERLTAIALGVRPIPGGGSESLPWREWRRLRDTQRSVRSSSTLPPGR